MSLHLSLSPFDGKNTEGIGSVVYYHILLNMVSNYLNVKHSFPGFINLSHYSYNNYSSKEWDDSFTKFFNFPVLKSPDNTVIFNEVNSELFSFIEENRNTDEKILIDLQHAHISLMNYCSSRLDEIFTKERIDTIRNNLIYGGIKYFVGDVNICLHIRSGNPNDIPGELIANHREIYNPVRDFPRYENLISILKKKYSNKKVSFHVHSQGPIENFLNFLNLTTENFSVIMHLNDHPASDIYHMSNADLLIMANSSFSLIASLMNSNPTIVRDNFWHFTYSNSIKADYNYNINV
jgi:predicted RNA binding protein with dsRBD fold (UPF0201 family)